MGRVMIKLPLDFYNFICDYAFICDNLRTPSPHCQFMKVATACGDLLARQENRERYARCGASHCQPLFFATLRHAGIKDDTLDAIDMEYGRLQDERSRVAGMDSKEMNQYIRRMFRRLQLKPMPEVEV